MRAAKLETSKRRRQIAEAALSLISARGIRGLSMAGLARRVGIAPSAIYRHYAGRDQVLDAALEYIHEHFRANVTRARHASADPYVRLRELARRHATFFMENLAIPRIVFSDEAVEDRPERRARIHGMIREYLASIAAMIREGQAEGSVGRDLDADTAALLLLGLIMPAGILRHLSAGQFDVLAHVERAWPAYESILRNTNHAPSGGSETRSRRRREKGRSS